MKILAIETSCDETAAAVAVDFESGVKILSNIVSSQIELHKKYGGVVPEVAAREHVLDILPVIDRALHDAGIDRHDLSAGKKVLDAIAVTKGPGLMSSLQTGVETAKSLALAWHIPLVAVNHIEGHIYANFIDAKQEIKFPAIVLTVSGGHTILVLMKGYGDFEMIGETRDDAAGEAFDKAAKLMGIGYPGGPVVSAYAEQLRIINKLTNLKSQFKIHLPRPMMDADNFDFSFSGLKTAIRYALEADTAWRERIPEYCYEFQEAVCDVLVAKTIRAAKKYDAKTVMMAGGVSANKRLRELLEQRVKNELGDTDFVMPELKYTTDNAAMIASAGIFKFQRGETTDFGEMSADCNFNLS